MAKADKWPTPVGSTAGESACAHSGSPEVSSCHGRESEARLSSIVRSACASLFVNLALMIVAFQRAAESAKQSDPTLPRSRCKKRRAQA
jgi:hypothetical protein